MDKKTEKYVLCGNCKKPIHKDDLGSISKIDGFYHKDCKNIKLPKKGE